MKRIAILLTALASAQAAEPGLVVLDYQARGILDKTVLRELWDRTWSIAASFPAAKTVGAEESRRRVFDQNVLVPSRCDEACYQRLAGKLFATRLIVPSVDKSGEQLKFNLQLVDGESGKKLQEVSVWSDGRVDRALESGVSKLLAGSAASDAIEIPSGLWPALGAGAAGLGMVLWLGLEQHRVLPAGATKQDSVRIVI